MQLPWWKRQTKNRHYYLHLKEGCNRESSVPLSISPALEAKVQRVWSEGDSKHKTQSPKLFSRHSFIWTRLWEGQGFPDSSVGKESTCNSGKPQFDSWDRNIRWRRDRPPTPVFLGFHCNSAGKESACNEGDIGLIPVLVSNLHLVGSSSLWVPTNYERICC